MKTIFSKTLLQVTLALATLSLCSCEGLMTAMTMVPDPSMSGHHQRVMPMSVPNPMLARQYYPQPHMAFAPGSAHAPQGANLGGVLSSLSNLNDLRNPVGMLQEAAGKGLAGLLPMYGVGASESYQRQAAQAYGHMSGRGHIGGMTLNDAMQD